jgi:acyl-ACP thioesterase
LREQNKLWVLSRLALEIERYPAWGQKLRVETWPRFAKSVFAWRDFEMFDQQGNRFAAGASAWLVLEAVRRKPVRVDRHLAAMGTLPDRRALPQDPESLSFADPTNCSWEPVAFQVRWSDLDVNGHPNYSSYIDWIIDAQPGPWLQQQEVRALQVNYLSEATVGSAVMVRSAIAAAGQQQHLLMIENDAVCRAQTDWRPRIGR